MSLKVAVAGCSGRMGLTLVKCVHSNKNVTLAAGSERPNYDETAVKAQLETVGCHNLFVTSDPDTLVREADAVLDFTTPTATLAMAAAVAKTGGIHIVGTTGFSPEQQKELAGYAKKVRIVQSGNFSLGVNLLETLVEKTARILDESYDI